MADGEFTLIGASAVRTQLPTGHRARRLHTHWLSFVVLGIIIAGCMAITILHISICRTSMSRLALSSISVRTRWGATYILSSGMADASLYLSAF